MTGPKRSVAATAAPVASAPGDLSDALRRAVTHHQSGELDAAAALYQTVLDAVPDNPDALHLLGVVSHQKGDNARAVDMIGKAIALNPANAAYHANLGVALQKLSRTDEAVEAYRRALRIDPAHADANGNLANLLKDKGETDEAIRHYEAAIAYQPRPRTTHKHLGSLYLDRDRAEDAAALFRQYLAVAPNDAEANNNYGFALEKLERHEEAERYYRRAHELVPDSAQICSNLGNCLKRLQRFEESRKLLAAATKLAPDDIRIQRNYAIALLDAKDHAAAIVEFRRLIEREPDHPGYHNDIGTCLARLGRPNEAMPHFMRACELEPNVASHAANLGACFLQQNRFEEAVASYRRAVKIDPLDTFIHANFCTALEMAEQFDEANLYSHFAILLSGWTERMNPSVAGVFRSTCDFDALATMGDLIGTCERHVEPENLIGVFLNLRPLTGDVESDRRVTALHRKWGEEMMARAEKSPMPAPASIRGQGKIKLGILSSDLRSHVVAKFIKPIFDLYDRDRFELHCYTQFDLPGDPTQADLRRKSTSFRIIEHISDRETAEMIRADGIDILFDLNGATRNSRIEAMAWRPAPVQVSYLGYGGTTGMSTVDYALMDRYLAPTEPGLWTETPLLMKGAWICFSDYPEEPIADELPMERNGVVTFGTMNAPYKFTPETIALWSQIMHAVPGSRMLFVRPQIKSVVLQTNLAKAFAKNDIAADRLYFLPNAHGQFNHLPHYNEIDIALDTYPAVGGTTTCDTLWMGVPVIGRYGPNMHQRINHAILNHCGLGEFSVATPEEYVANSVALAGDTALLGALRRELRNTVRSSPLYDAEGFVADFQDRMMEIVQKHGLR